MDLKRIHLVKQIYVNLCRIRQIQRSVVLNLLRLQAPLSSFSEFGSTPDENNGFSSITGYFCTLGTEQVLQRAEWGIEVPGRVLLASVGSPVV